MKWMKYIFPAFLIFMLLSFSGCAKPEDTPTPLNSDTAYRLAWQYLLSEAEEHYHVFNITDAKITRFEPVAYQQATQGNIHVYALEYALFATQDYGWIPGGDGLGSTYLFMAEQGEDVRLLAAAGSKKVYDNGGYSGMIKALLQDNSSADYAKQSVLRAEDQQTEINDAIHAAEAFFLDKDCLTVNIWYDWNTSLDFWERSPDVLPEQKGNTIILCADLYFWSEHTTNLFHISILILTRENEEAPWTIKTYGF